MNASTVVWIVVVLVVVVGGIWYFSATPGTVPPTPTSTTSESTSTGATSTATTTSGEGSQMSVTVTYTSQGFSPKQVNVAKGGTVTFVNSGGPNMWVASDQHPSHTAYSGTTRDAHCPDTSGAAFDQCGPGASFSFKFDKAGSWKFHNHMNAADGGTVIVQ